MAKHWDSFLSHCTFKSQLLKNKRTLHSGFWAEAEVIFSGLLGLPSQVGLTTYLCMLTSFWSILKASLVIRGFCYLLYMARSSLVLLSLVLLKYTWVLAKASEPLSLSWKQPFARHLFVTHSLSHYECSLAPGIAQLPVSLKQYKVFISLSNRENPCHSVASLSPN